MSDYIVRAAAADLQIRAFAITSRELVEKARSIHNTSPVATAALGRLLSAGSMMGAMMKGEQDLLTLQIKGDGPHRRHYGDGGLESPGQGLCKRACGADSRKCEGASWTWQEPLEMEC